MPCNDLLITSIISTIILVTLIVLTTISEKKKFPLNHRFILWLGATSLILAIIFDNGPFWILGLILLVWGYIKK